MERIPSAFVAKMSHDLKTPVGNAMMYAELMQDDLRALAEEHPELQDKLMPLEHYCRNIHLSSSKLVNAIHSWSYSFQLEDSEFKIDETAINVREMLDEIIQRNEIFIKGKALDVAVDYQSGREVYHTDQELFKLIVDNLMTLFLNMGKRKSPIHIKVLDDEQGMLFRFVVSEAAFHAKLIDIYTGDIDLRYWTAPEQGVLKPGGYSLIFTNLALRYIGAAKGVDPEGQEDRSFWFRLPLS